MKRFARLILLLTVFLLSFISAKAQEIVQGKGKAIIYFYSSTPVTVRLDTTLLKQTTDPILLAEGKYVVKAWAPTKKLLTDTLIIKEGKTTICAKKLEDADDYGHYKTDMLTYKLKKTSANFICLPVTLIYSGVMYSRYSANKRKMKEHYDNAESARKGYENSISLYNIDLYKARFNDEKNDYELYLNKNNHLIRNARIIIPAGIALSALCIYLGTKIKKPAYTEARLLTFNSLYIEKGGAEECSVGLRFNINTYPR